MKGIYLRGLNTHSSPSPTSRCRVVVTPCRPSDGMEEQNHKHKVELRTSLKICSGVPGSVLRSGFKSGRTAHRLKLTLPRKKMSLRRLGVFCTAERNEMRCKQEILGNEDLATPRSHRLDAESGACIVHFSLSSIDRSDCGLYDLAVLYDSAARLCS